MNTHWEKEIVTFLSDLSGVQEATLSLLKRKGELLAKCDKVGLTKIAEEEKLAIDQLQKCLDRREQLLKIAKGEGLPNDSIQSLAKRLDKENPNSKLKTRCRDSVDRSRLLQHQSLANWVVTQRTLIHLSQILEIIATKGKPDRTYNRKNTREPVRTGGALVDVCSG